MTKNLASQLQKTNLMQISLFFFFFFSWWLCNAGAYRWHVAVIGHSCQQIKLRCSNKESKEHFSCTTIIRNCFVPSCHGSQQFRDACSSISSVQLLSRVRLFVTPWIAALQASLSITNSWSPLRFMSTESVMPSSHLNLCCLLLLPSTPPSIKVFSNESTLHMRWPKYQSFSFSIIPSKEIPGLISFRMDCSRVFSNTTLQKHQFFGAQPSSQSNSHIDMWPLEKP